MVDQQRERRSLSMEQRLQRVERDVLSHAEIITGYNGRFKDNGDRIEVLEIARQERRVIDAAREEREIARSKEVDGRFDRLETQNKAIIGTVYKVSFIILASVLGSVILFMMKGGFYIK